MSEVLTGERVLLRHMTAEDAELVVGWRNKADVHSQLFSSILPTTESHKQWFERMKQRGDRHEFIIIEREGQTPLGTFGLSSIDALNHHAEYGGLLGDSSARGRGYAFEASRLLLDYGFKMLELNRIYLRLFTTNSRALSLYERLGFKDEGIMRQHVFKNGEFHDILIMGILRGEWK